MIDGTQLLTMFAIFFYMGIGAVVGFIAGLFLIPGFCVAHPIVLAWWERYRMTMEVRKGAREATKILAEKVREADLTRRKFDGSNTTNQQSN